MRSKIAPECPFLNASGFIMVKVRFFIVAKFIFTAAKVAESSGFMVCDFEIPTKKQLSEAYNGQPELQTKDNKLQTLIFANIL